MVGSKHSVLDKVISDGLSEALKTYVRRHNDILIEDYPDYEIRLKPNTTSARDRETITINGKQYFVPKPFFTCSGPGGGVVCSHTVKGGLTMENAILGPNRARQQSETSNFRTKCLVFNGACYICTIARRSAYAVNHADALDARLTLGLCAGSLSCPKAVLEGQNRCDTHQEAYDQKGDFMLRMDKDSNLEGLSADALDEYIKVIEHKLSDKQLPGSWNNIRLQLTPTFYINSEFVSLLRRPRGPRNTHVCTVSLVHATTGRVVLHVSLDYGKSLHELNLLDDVVALNHVHRRIASSTLSRWYGKHGPGANVTRMTPQGFGHQLQKLAFRQSTVIEWSAWGCDIANIEQVVSDHTTLDPSTIIPPPDRQLSALRLGSLGDGCIVTKAE